MKRLTAALLTSVLAATLSGLPASAQDDHHDRDRSHDQDRSHDHDRDHHDDQGHGYVRHNEWRRGAAMRHEDWDRGQRLDWRAHHLRRPPRGYEWREVDGNYVMAAVATGVIASILAANAAR